MNDASSLTDLVTLKRVSFQSNNHPHLLDERHPGPDLALEMDRGRAA